MPDGAQAWKMIKTPGSQSGRIAQACDRCRSKKIKCDGKRPNCSQCAAVGFECKITDKLTRRAFPRGYTESLEDRVRQLESETKKLTQLLDLKDEQMELMSKVEDVHHPFHQPNSSQPQVAETIKSCDKSESQASSSEDEEEVYVVKQVNTLRSDGTYRGASTGSVFAQVLKDKLFMKAPSSVEPLTWLWDSFESSQAPTAEDAQSGSLPRNAYSFDAMNICSRLSCDQLVTRYFQEWHSMYAIVDENAFLEAYQQFVDSPDQSTQPSIFSVTLVIVLALASLTNPAQHEAKALEKEFKRLFTPQLQAEASLETAQALCLANLFALHTGNFEDVWHYRMLSVGMVYRLGLHRCQQKILRSDGTRLSFREQEMRRRLFWTIYMFDTFSGIVLGSPPMISLTDATCKMPQSIDDEFNENAPQQQQPSCALAMIQLTKILSTILSTIYSSSDKTSHHHKVMIQLEDQLESWKRELDPSLRFEFANGAPTTTLAPVHQKSPLLLMMYHYARVLLHMPSIAPVSNSKNSGAAVAAMHSAKTFLQVFNYLSCERKVVSTLCVNPSKTLIRLSAIVLYSAVDYSRGGALLQDTRNLMSAIQEFVYCEMQHSRVGSVSGPSYQWFEEVCDSILGNASCSSSADQSRRKSSTTSNSSRRRSRKESPSSRNSSVVPVHDDVTIKPEMISPSSSSADDSSPLSIYSQPPTQINIPYDMAPPKPQHNMTADDLLQPITMETLLFKDLPAPPPQAHHHSQHAMAATDDYFDFWNPIDYMNICRQEYMPS
ncbi:hypothetical protein TRVA0_012S02256 [Trichomonascus vanleenenianus]|uniref:uncharacterized protein n=1 Tax=Trichomonascus vanleenenianus TaxID=2268995 RepID=UPI003EC99A99